MKSLYIPFIISFFFLGQNILTAQETGKTPADGDGITYNWVKIGNQYWMSENLRTTKFLNGTPIANQTALTSADWFALLNQADGTGIPAYATHTDQSYVIETDGLLYNWFAITDGQKICPEGWSVPSDDDFKALETTLGMSADDLDKTGFRGDAGTKLKSSSRDFLGTNEAGFNGLPSGCRNPTGAFAQFNKDMWLWATTVNPDNFNQAHRRVLRNAETGINRGTAAKSGGFCVRCFKNSTTAVKTINSDASSKIESVSFYSLTGTLVNQKYEALPNGIYIKRTIYSNGNITTEKIFKNWQ